MPGTNNGNVNSNLHVVTAAELEDFGVMIWAAMKKFVLEGQETSTLAVQVSAVIDEIARETIQGNLREKANAVKDAVQKIYNVLENAGADVSKTKLSQLSDIIRDLTATYEICILDKEDRKWSVAGWESYKEQYGTTPSEGAVVAVLSPYQSFVIAPNSFSRQYGTTGYTVSGLYGQQTGSFLNVLQNSLQFKGLENTRRTLLFANPEVLPHISYDPDDESINYAEYQCVRFASYQQMIDSGLHLTYDQQVYIVTSDENSLTAEGEPTANMAYYWNGSAYAKRFAVPLVDTQKIKGAPAAETCWNYEAWPGDERQWHLPMINHLLMCFVYYSEINKHLYALNRSTLPSGNAWCAQEGNANNQYCVTVSSGAVNNNGKYSTCSALPVAALQKTKSF